MPRHAILLAPFALALAASCQGPIPRGGRALTDASGADPGLVDAGGSDPEAGGSDPDAGAPDRDGGDTRDAAASPDGTAAPDSDPPAATVDCEAGCTARTARCGAGFPCLELCRAAQGVGTSVDATCLAAADAWATCFIETCDVTLCEPLSHPFVDCAAPYCAAHPADENCQFLDG